jgi:hypothetical protein
MAEMDGIANCLSQWQSPDVENVIHSFALYVRCEGKTKTELFKSIVGFNQSDIRKCIVSFCGDVYKLHDYSDDTVILMKNQVQIPSMIFTNVTDFTLSNDASELFLLNQRKHCITVHSVHDGSFLRKFASVTGNGDGSFLRKFALVTGDDDDDDDGASDEDEASDDDDNPRIECIHMNKLGQIVYLFDDFNPKHTTTDRLMYVIISPADGTIISETLLELDYYNLLKEHDKILITPDPIDGLIFVGIKQYNSIYVFNAVTGKLIRKMFGDNMYIHRNKYEFSRGKFDFTDGYDFQHVFAEDGGVFIDRNGHVMHEVTGAHTFDLNLKPVISAIGEIVVRKQDSFVIYNTNGEFLRKFYWVDEVASFTLDNQGRLIICEPSGTAWCVE